MSILKNFVKYHSLGNDFVIFDWYKRPSVFMENELHGSAWKQFIARICDRHYGVGADGVLIVTSSQQVGMPELLVFNADGNQAETCLNGLRCVAHYLFIHYNFPNHFSIKVGSRTIECTIQAPQSQGAGHTIITRVGSTSYEGECTLALENTTISGHIVSVGNPHFVIFEKTTVEWLQAHGKLLESHERFPNKTNVEFVWKSTNNINDKETYEVLVYERGCGITLACSSGAAAIVGLLFSRGSIHKMQPLFLKMQGGAVEAWIDNDGQIILQANAQLIFKGAFEDQIEEYRQLRPQPVPPSRHQLD